MLFSYKKIPLSPDGEDFLWRPIIRVGLVKGQDRIDFQALIDSGADRCIFPEEFAKQLEINFSDTETYEFQGVSGEQSRGYISQVDIQLKDKRFTSEVVFSQAISNQGFGILGQKGFFDQFQITFNFQDLLIELEE